CAKFNHVYLILGNHEFYGLTRQAGLEAVAKLQAEPCLQSRLTILNRQRVDISEEVTLLGCTLHSHILPEARAIVEAKISDFRKISDWTVDEHNKEHLLDLDWLRSEVASIEENEPKRRVIIATHHAPSYANTTNPAFEQSPWGSAFCTSILESKAEEHWLHARCLRYWIFGHTHWTCQFLSKNIVVVSNQRGYDRDPTHPPAEGSPKPKLLRLFSGPKTAGFDVHKTISI
ncbi:hypothetical protein MMC12_007516, partial [Toensbergia leucococca]|nr:hypothetical protein [Toensbergia leucococca]